MDQRLIYSLRSRMAWSLANRILKQQGAPTGRGWENTAEKLQVFKDGPIEDFLRSALHEHVQCGEKFTKFYRISAENIEALRRIAIGLMPDDSSYLAHYPLLLTEDELADVDNDPKLCEIIKSDDGIGIVYCSRQHITTREEINIEEYIEDFVEDLTEIELPFDTIIGEKHRPVQLYNLIWIPHHQNIIEIRTDYPNGMPQDVAHGIHSMMRNKLNDLVEEDVALEPIDLFPLVRSMYDDDDEGDVVELAFGTTTASTKHEKMRRAKLCLRKEIYHKAGKQALDAPINPYRICVRWHLDHGDFQRRPELGLYGTSKGQHTIKDGEPAGQIISAARIMHCAGVVDYEHVTGRIVAHITNHIDDSGP